MTYRPNKILAVFLGVVAAMCCVSIIVRLARATDPSPGPFFVPVTCDVVLAMVAVFGARAWWFRGEKRVTVSEWE